MATIKNQLLQAMVTAIANASDLMTVKRFPPTGIDLDTVQTPACFIHEAAPEVRTTNNRFYQGELELDLITFIALDETDIINGNVTFLDQADEIQGQIHDILFGASASGLAGLALRILERSVEKGISNNSWGHIIYTINVTYQHLVGNASSRGNTS